MAKMDFIMGRNLLASGRSSMGFADVPSASSASSTMHPVSFMALQRHCFGLLTFCEWQSTAWATQLHSPWDTSDSELQMDASSLQAVDLYSASSQNWVCA